MKVLIFIDEIWDCNYTNLPVHTPVIYDTETGNYEIVEYNLDTSALPLKKSEDIVRTACITKEDAESKDKEL